MYREQLREYIPYALGTRGSEGHGGTCSASHALPHNPQLWNWHRAKSGTRAVKADDAPTGGEVRKRRGSPHRSDRHSRHEAFRKRGRKTGDCFQLSGPSGRKRHRCWYLTKQIAGRRSHGHKQVGCMRAHHILRGPSAAKVRALVNGQRKLKKPLPRKARREGQPRGQAGTLAYSEGFTGNRLRSTLVWGVLRRTAASVASARNHLKSSLTPNRATTPVTPHIRPLQQHVLNTTLEMRVSLPRPRWDDDCRR